MAQYAFEPAEHITAWWRARGRYRSGWVIIRTVGDPPGTKDLCRHVVHSRGIHRVGTVRLEMVMCEREVILVGLFDQHTLISMYTVIKILIRGHKSIKIVSVQLI
jgi:hypothetical protein